MARRIAYIDFDPDVDEVPELVVIRDDTDEPELQAPLGPIPEEATEQDLPRADPRYVGLGALCARADDLLDDRDLFRLEDWQESERGYAAEVDDLDGYMRRPVVFPAPVPDEDYPADRATFAHQVAEEMERWFPGRSYIAVSESDWDRDQLLAYGYRVDLDDDESYELRSIIGALHRIAWDPDTEEESPER